jgi:CMP/dCMP kinase
MAVPVLTIDGPSGAGKGTISRAVAKRLDWHYLDSGSIYRSLAIALLQRAVDVQDVAAVVMVATELVLEFECGDDLSVKLEGVDITAQLGLEETGRIASTVAVYPEVR